MSIFSPLNNTARPLGNRAYRSGSLGVDAALVPASPVGVDMSKYNALPWMVNSPSTVTLQNTLNPLLAAAGYCGLTADGILGPATCGAAKTLGLQVPTPCKSTTAPALLSSGCGKAAASPAKTPAVVSSPISTPTPTAAPVAPTAPTGISQESMLIGGVAILALGLGYYYAKKKGMV